MPRTAVDERVRLFGIRHHGPGSARSLVDALEEWRPQVLLVEGPAESSELVPFMLEDTLATPVAMLFYAVDTPRWATYYPLADFSPELQAFRWTVRADVPVRFMDLPASAMLGLSVADGVRSDALDRVASSAGYADTQEWWDHLVERRTSAEDLFAGIEMLMTAARSAESEPSVEEEADEEDGRRKVSLAVYEEMREAHMRTFLREALAESHERIAVVCGAWHVPALRTLSPARADKAILKGLPKVKTRGTIVPWTFDLMTSASGYGAGAASPAYYDLTFRTAPADLSMAWLFSVARLMREEDLDASPAGVIEAVRLADALAAIRGRTWPGLRELHEAAASVLIRDSAIWSLIRRRLIVGDRMGSVPSGIPVLPLQADLAAQQKRLRLPVDGTDRRLELDLRTDTDLQRSHLLHRLGLLEVRWAAREEAVGRKKGTFHEVWRLQWRPEFAIALVEASVYGHTVAQAATGRAVEAAERTQGLAEVAALVQRALIADLPDAIAPAISKLESIAATSPEVGDLTDALPPLTEVVRYGTVRRTEADQVRPVLDAIFVRLCVGLPGACLSLDDDAAGEMLRRLNAVHTAVGLFEDAEKATLWSETLAKVALLHGVHGNVAGKAERLRFDLGVVDGDYLALRLGQEASVGATPKETAAFLEGLLDGPGGVVVHQESLLRALDAWLAGLDGGVFEEILPLVRRSFSLFTRPERRQIGERMAGRTALAPRSMEFNEERALRVLPTVRAILGLSNE